MSGQALTAWLAAKLSSSYFNEQRGINEMDVGADLDGNDLIEDKIVEVWVDLVRENPLADEVIWLREDYPK